MSTVETSLPRPVVRRSPGRALPLSRYADPDVFAAELEHAFRREWLLVGRADEVAEPGDYLAIDVLDEPLVVARGDDGRLRGLSRLCSHRGFPLVEEGTGHTRRFRCGYHRWTFRTDGSLAGAPLAADLDGFDAADRCLPEVPVEEWLGFVFVCLDPDVAPLAPRVEPVAAGLAPFDPAAMVSVVLTDEVWACNWKLGLENASESYHHTGTHPTTVGPFAPPTGSWVEPGGDQWALHRTTIVDGAARTVSADDAAPAVGIEPLDHLIDLPADEADAFRCYTIFPSAVVLMWRSACTWLTFLPEAPDRTRVRTGVAYPAAIRSDPRWPELADHLTARTNAVNHEDRDALERLQRACRSRLAQPGPLVPQEGVLAQLYQYLAHRTSP